MKAKINFPELLLKIIIFIGLALAILNFFYVRNLWVDELKIAKNLINKPILELLKPLDYYQVAPIGFLFLEKFIASIFNYTDWSFRIITLLSYFASTYLIYKVTYSILKDKIHSLLSAALLCTSFNIFYFSLELKQYSLDVTICLLILLATIKFSKSNTKKKVIIYTILGALSVWFSNVSVIILFSAGLSLIFLFYKNRDRLKQLLVVFSGWLVSFSFYYFLFIHNHPAKVIMLTYWENAGAFLPKDILNVNFYKIVILKLYSLFKIFENKYIDILLIPIFLFSILYLWKKNKSTLVILILPIIVHLTLSYLKIYPFTTRLILYLYPIVFILLTIGIFKLKSALKLSYLNIFYPLLFIPLLYNIYVVSKKNFIIEREEITKSLTFLNKKFSKNDKLYVYYAANSGFIYYRNKFPQVSKINDASIIFGKANRDNWPKYEVAIKAIKTPVWVLFSHVYGKTNKDEESYIIDLFLKHNFYIIEQEKFTGSSIYKVTPN